MMSRCAVVAMVAMLAAAVGACGDGGGDGGSADVPRSVEPNGWVAFDRGAFNTKGGIAFIGVDDDNNPRVGRGVGDKPKAVSPEGIEPTDFAWMPDGRSILIADRADEDGDRLAIYDLAGKRLRSVPMTLKGRFGYGMVVRADGNVAIATIGEPSDQYTYTDLVEIDLTTGGTRNLTNTPDLAEGSPEYLDDHELLFSNGKLIGDAEGPNGWLGVLDVAAGSVRRLTPENQAVESGTSVNRGTAVAYVAMPPPHRDQTALWWVPIVGGGPTRLMQIDGFAVASLDQSNTVLYSKTGSIGRPGGLEVIRLTSPIEPDPEAREALQKHSSSVSPRLSLRWW